MNNLTDQELELALKLNKHKIFLQRFFVFSLFFVNLLIMYNLWYRWVIYSSQTPGYLHDQPKAENLVNFSEFHERNRPQPLFVLEQGSLSSDTRSYDYYARVTNQNERWIAVRAKLELRFPTETIFKTVENLLPQESRIIAVFRRSGTAPDAFLVESKETSWKRLREDPPTLSDWIRITDPSSQVIQGPSQLVETTFTLNNLSTYGLWKVPYAILLYDSDSLIGLNELTTTRVEPGEARQIKTPWLNLPLPPNRVEIQLNPTAILDPNNRYLAGQ